MKNLMFVFTLLVCSVTTSVSYAGLTDTKTEKTSDDYGTVITDSASSDFQNLQLDSLALHSTELTFTFHRYSYFSRFYQLISTDYSSVSISNKGSPKI